MLESSGFYDWLISEKQMSARSAKDVISRCKRVCKILNSEMINASSADSLSNSEFYGNASMFIKSQLKRAIALCLEYEAKDE